jgi:hypothetical protein
MKATFAQKGNGMTERRFPELAMFGRPSNAFSRVGVCQAGVEARLAGCEGFFE